MNNNERAIDTAIDERAIDTMYLKGYTSGTLSILQRGGQCTNTMCTNCPFINCRYKRLLTEMTKEQKKQRAVEWLITMYGRDETLSMIVEVLL